MHKRVMGVLRPQLKEQYFHAHEDCYFLLDKFECKLLLL